MRLDVPFLDQLVREYCVYRGIVNSGIEFLLLNLALVCRNNSKLLAFNTSFFLWIFLIINLLDIKSYLNLELMF